MSAENIEIPSVDILEEEWRTVQALRELAQSLELEFGWHYLLDLAWILKNLGPIEGKSIMDAGAGTGIMQWYLALQGATVISVDRGSRAELPVRFRRRFKAAGLRQGAKPDLIPASQLLIKSLVKPKQVIRFVIEAVANLSVQSAPGKVLIYNQDLISLTNIQDNTLDAVVAVSALEHNPPEELPAVVAELIRVLKPGGKLLATLCAARDKDWYHAPSAGWCYTDVTLRRLFSLPENTPSNYDHYDALFAALSNCSELRDNLATFYTRSGDNGMPWGKWDPQYQPVGICKIKQ
jgi:SAM-dependent methyltransferase